MLSDGASPRLPGGRRGWAAVAVALAAAAVSVGLGGGVGAENAFLVDRDEGRYGAYRHAYVGYAPEGFDPAAGYDAARVEDALEAWRARHADARVVEARPVSHDGLRIGYRVVYEVAPPTAPADLVYEPEGAAGEPRRDALSLAT